MSTFNISNPLYIVNKSANVDSRYGPWTSVADANSNIDLNVRAIGLTVGVSAIGLGVAEYWYKNGTQNQDLILKINGEINNIDGGSSTSVYLLNQNINGGFSNTF